MARNFDGANDNIDFGSDASIDNFFGASPNTGTIAYWIDADNAGAQQHVIGKSIFSNAFAIIIHSTTVMRCVWEFSTERGIWDTTADHTDGTDHHSAFTFDGSSVTNDPTSYLDGSSETPTEVITPIGTINSDAAQSLLAGEESGGGRDMTGDLMCLCYDDAIWSSADVNRARWWGVAPGGPSTVQVWHPLWTSDLTNKGLATANGTATGTTMTSMPKVERMWGSMMGVGR